MLDHSQIIDAVVRDYIGVLNRYPDAAGLDFWVSKVEDGSLTLEGVTNAFADQAWQNPHFNFGQDVNSSTVVDSHIVSSMYLWSLGRLNDQAGEAFWAHSGVTVGQLFNILLSTPEFIKGTEIAVENWEQQIAASDPPPTAPGSLILIGHMPLPDALFV